MNGREYHVVLSDLQASDFWSFFHISETARVPTPAWGTTLSLQPGAFREHVNLKVEIDDSQRIRQAELRLRREWVMEGGINPFAADIAKSFIEALTPEPSREYILPAVAAIWEITDRERTMARFKDSDSWTAELLAVYVGAHPQTSIPQDFSTLDVSNVEEMGQTWLSLTIETH